MSKKHTQKYLKPTAFIIKDSIFEGLTWQLANSKGTGTYDITLEPKGFTCDCPGFSFRGKCKHSQEILQRVEDAVDNINIPQYHCY
jgi:hypothetical protein